MSSFSLIKKFLKSTPKYKKTLEIYSKLFKENDIKSVGLSLNGGKDSTVVLFLTLFYLEKLKKLDILKCIYMKEKNPFNEILQYLKHLKNTENI